MGLQENRDILRTSRPVLVGTFFFLAVLSFVCLHSQTALAAPGVVVVSPTHLQEWQSEPGTGGLPAGFIVDASAPLSRGALRLQTIDSQTGQSKVRFVTPLHGISLSSVLMNGAGYYTKQDNITILSSLPSYQIDIQLDDQAASTTTLIYEPYLNGGETAIHAREWQRWDVSGGTFSSTQTVGGLTADGRYTLAEVADMLPEATVLRVGVGIGSGSLASHSDIDAFVFNGTTYDFGPDMPAAPQNFQLYGADSQIIACGSATNIEALELRWDAVAGDVVRYEYEVRLSGATAPEPISADLQTAVVASIVSDGQWLLRVRAVNSIGAASDWSPECSIYIDRTAPVLTMSVGNNSSATSRIISGTTNDVDSPIIVVVNEVSYEVTPGLTGNWALTLEGLDIGTHNIEVTSIDAVGNMAALSARLVVETPIQVTISDVQLDEAIDALSQPFSLPQSISVSLNSTVQQPRITPSDIEAIESQIKNNSDNRGESDVTSKGVIAAQSDEGWQLFGIAWYWWALSVLGGAVGVWYFKPTRAT